LGPPPPPPAIKSMRESFRSTQSRKIKGEELGGAIVAVSAAGKDGEEPKQDKNLWASSQSFPFALIGYNRAS
jgi:hypothetical protein